MPESERLERQKEIEGALARLSRAVEAAEASLGRMRDRVQRAESESGRLRQVVNAPAGPEGADFEARLVAVTEENRELKETLLEARERAKRLRSRLEVVEDEV